MANCDNQIYDFWDASGHQSYNDCPNDTKMAWILIDREVGAVWVCPVCEDDGGYTGKIDVEAVAIHEFFNNPQCTCDGKGGLEMHRLDNIYGCLECAGDDEVIDIDAEESFAGLCEVCGNHTVSAPNRSEVVCTFCPAVVA